MVNWWHHVQEGTYTVRYIIFSCRLAAMLRQLAQFHAKDPNNLFMVRIAQGLTHLGKGTLTLCPYHSDRQLLSPVALAGLLSTLVGFLDVKNSKYCHMLHTVSSFAPYEITICFLIFITLTFVGCATCFHAFKGEVQ